MDCKVKISEVFCFKEKCRKSLELLRKIFKVPEKIVVNDTIVREAELVVDPVVVPEPIISKETEPKFVIVKNEKFEVLDVEQKKEEEIEQIELIMDNEEEEEDEEEIYLDEEFIMDNEKSSEELLPEKYKCAICNEEFLKSNDIKLHLKEAHSENIDIFEISGDEMYLEYNEMEVEENESDAFTFEELNESKEFLCAKCNLHFDSIKTLQDHQLELHPKQSKNKSKRSHQGKYYCEICLINIRGDDRINFHIEMHKRTLPILLETINYFKCGKCHQIFLEQLELFDHTDCSEEDSYESPNNENFMDPYLTDVDNCQNKIFTCEKYGDDKYKCSLCDVVFDNKMDSVAKHFHEDHNFIADIEAIDSNQLYKSIRCSICKTTVKTLKEAISHIYIVHSKSFNCPFDGCGNEYNLFSKLSLHIERLHIQEKHSCKHCMAVFESSQELSIHLREQCIRRVLICNFCDKKFLTDFSLKLHLRIHNKEKRFSCTYCDKKFIQRGDLTTHERIHTGDRPYKCGVCNNRFRTSGHKKDHMSTHVSDKNFECTICFKKFKAERILKGHMKAHENGKQFSCPGKFFCFFLNQIKNKFIYFPF